MKKILTFAVAALMACPAMAQKENVPVKVGQYTSDWESLKAWECPEWFKDVKFGIWAHWGPQCQAERGDWWARFMYYQNPYPYANDYGLKDLCNDWKADKWNPEELVKLYYEAGARYFFTLGNHHDNFDLWDSPYQEWNSVNIGPKRDIVKGWSDACKKYNLPFGISMHASHTWTWMEISQKYDGNITKEEGSGKWWEGYDPQELYAQRHTPSSGWENSGTIHSQWAWSSGASQPSNAYKTKFQNRVLQCINDYNPDMIYFDDTVLPFYGCDESIGLNIVSHYYNNSAEQHGGQQQVVVMGKILNEDQKEALLWDVERGIPDRPQEKYWQTCTCIGDWHYNTATYNNNSYKSSDQVISMLVDIVSKNGNLLLSIPIKGDGTIDSHERERIAGIKAWMDVNSESIYGTRPWVTFGEGPNAEASNALSEQGFNEGNNYSAEDVRYVQKDGNVYATIMRWPSASEFTFKAFSLLAESYAGKVESVKLLGYEGEIGFEQGVQGLTVKLPTTHPTSIAPVFKVTLTEDTRTEIERVSDIKTGLVEMGKGLTRLSPINTGWYNTEAVEAFIAAVEAVEVSPENVATAREELVNAYASLNAKGINPGGVFKGVVDKNVTVEYLKEANAFARTSDSGTARFGKPVNWTVENFSIPNGGEGVKQGLDKYMGDNATGQECLMLGVWDDASKNQEGNLANARIYQKVTLPAGQYYFGAAYNQVYNLTDRAYMFVSESIENTEDIPEKALVYYNLNKCTKTLVYQGLYFELNEEKELYIGFQADLSTSNQAEFRAERICLYTLGEKEEKTQGQGWQLIEDNLPSDVSQYFFAINDIVTGNGVRLADDGSGDMRMFYKQQTKPEEDKALAWQMIAFDGNNWSMAQVENLNNIVFVNTTQYNYLMEVKEDATWVFHIDKGSNEWPDRAYLAPTYDIANAGWAFRANKGSAYLGPWTAGNTAEGEKIAANKSNAEKGLFKLYAIKRGEYMEASENLDDVAEENPLDITYLITNPSFEMRNLFHDWGNPTPIGWNLEGDIRLEGSGWLPGCDGTWYVNHWQGSGKLSDRSVTQTIQGLPKGKYRLSVFTNCTGNNAFLFANEEEVQLNSKGTNGRIYVTFEITKENQLTLGVRLKEYDNNDCKYDDFKLEYLGGYVPTAMEYVKPADDGKVAYYNLSGLHLSKAPAKGVYIIRKDNTSRKVMK